RTTSRYDSTSSRISVHGDKQTEMLGPCRSVPPHPPRSAVRVKNQLSHLIVAPGAVDWDAWHSLGIPKPRQPGPISLESTTSAGYPLRLASSKAISAGRSKRCTQH